MNGFVIAAGSGISDLFDEALYIAEAIGEVYVDHSETSCQTPFAPDYLRKVQVDEPDREKEKDGKMLGRQCIFLLALLCGISLLRADEVTHFFDESLAPEESFAFAVSAQRGDLAFTGYLAEKGKSKPAIELLDELLDQHQSTRADALRLNLHFLPYS
jgi:hypothetical protein